MNEITSHRGKYTLAGVVVTAGILFYVFSLLTPAIVNSRDTSNGNTCRSNLSNIALAMLLYEGRNGRYPGYMNVLERTDGSAFVDRETGRVAPVSWVVELLSDLDRGPLYENWKMTPVPYEAIDGADPKASPFYATPRIDVYLEILTCPGQDLGTRQSRTPLSYVVNTGMPDLPESIPATPNKNGVMNGFPRDWMANGLLFDNYSDDKLIKSPASARGPQIVTQVSRIRDPKDKTILITENVDATSYVFDSRDFPKPGQVEVVWGSVWAPGKSTPNPAPAVPTGTRTFEEILYQSTAPILEPRDDVSAPNAHNDGRKHPLEYKYCRPSSPHAGGFNVAFAGKNVMFINDKISYFVYSRLMASDDAGIKFPGTQTLAEPRPYSCCGLGGLGDCDINP